MDSEFTVSNVPIRLELVSAEALQHSSTGCALSFLFCPQRNKNSLPSLELG